MGVISDGRAERLTATYIDMASQVLSTSSSRTLQLGNIAECKTFRPQRSLAITKLKLKRKVGFLYRYTFQQCRKWAGVLVVRWQIMNRRVG